MESEHESGSSRHSTTHTEVTISESGLFSPGKKSDSSSSSSRSSFDKNFFLLSENKLIKSNASTSSHPEGAQLASTSRDGEEDVHNEYSLKYEAYDVDSPGSTSPPMTQSPPVQLMVRSDEFSSYRIPSYVFAGSKSTTPTDWSAASNESLFSINVGNNSFSRDHYFLMTASGELGKPGELIFPSTKSGELIFPNTKKHLELIVSTNKPPPASATVDPEKKDSDLGLRVDVDVNVAEAAAGTIKEILRVATEVHTKEQMPPPADEFYRSPRIIPRHSDGSETSSVLFVASPKRKRFAWLSCYCCKGRGTLCHCKWSFCSCSNCIRPCCCRCSLPSCHCTLPSCKCCNCSCALCCCLNCCSMAYFIPSILRKGGRRASVKVEPEQQPQKQTQPHSQKRHESKWCPCCNCPSCC